MDHPFNDAELFDTADGNNRLLRIAKSVDIWALENPYQAAAAGAALGLATSLIFNRMFLLRGASAALSLVSGAVKGAITGYTYPTARGVKL